MTSIAKIAELAAADVTVRVPYRGEQHTVRELKARDVSLTAEDYALIRAALGGGKRGRARARELVPLQCPSCACRLTHFEPAQRPPYFAATVSSPEHREQCELRQAEEAVQPALLTAVEPEPVCVEAASEPVLEVTGEYARELDPDGAASALNTLYVIDEMPAQASDGSSWRARLGFPPAVPREADVPAGEHVRALPDARELLTLALNRGIPSDSQVRFCGENYVIVSATELHRRDDGELVAVYGRIRDAVWSEASGRLTLIAAPRTVQVWATAAAPRWLLGLRAGDPVEVPSLRKPMPFIAFGRLKKLADVCGIPVIRRECFVTLLPLDHAMTRPPTIPPVQKPVPTSGSTRAEPSSLPVSSTTAPVVSVDSPSRASPHDLTDELDRLLFAPLSVQPAQYVSAEAAIVQAFSPTTLPSAPEPAIRLEPDVLAPPLGSANG